MKIASSLALATGVALVSGCATPENPSSSSAPSAPRPKVVTRTSAQQIPNLGQASVTKSTAFDRYIERDEPVFAWKEISRKENVIDLEVTSQTWQGIVWKHRVEIVRPTRNEFPDRALINLGYGGGSERETFFAQIVANAMGATVVNAWNIPNQPLFDKREDDLIAYTFSKYLQDGDDTWPLLLPMTKSATQIMRAVRQWSVEGKLERGDKTPNQTLNKWVVSGASKRGWTTWLTAAAAGLDRASGILGTTFKSDRLQVVGIIPMVYDNLDLVAQMPHQIESWGKYSAQINDYAQRGLPDLANTPQGQKLVQIVDPFVYRDRLDLPKLIINGSNDAYWPLDSFNLYRNDLKGVTNVFYAPNSGHPLNGNEAKVAGISVAWFRALAKNQTMPIVNAMTVPTLENIPVSSELFNNQPRTNLRPERRYSDEHAQSFRDKPQPVALKTLKPDDKWLLQVLANGQTPNLKTARIWFATSKTRDFRQAKWQSLPLEAALAAPQTTQTRTRNFAMEAAQLIEKSGVNKGEFLAAWGEIELESDLPAQTGGLNLNLPFLLSSPVTIWKQ